MIKEQSRDKVESDRKGVISGDLDKFESKLDVRIEDRKEKIEKRN